ncbi:hypothetical protein [uncultured Tessaracoccus sp.]|uniref:hypothetical protein n=1 Tax=uncultured Tessaracoccus sp. TaxID=905023 RepID=UPI002623568F|nr:hypothetical protein [uncultured Tessaracoccus sp.]
MPSPTPRTPSLEPSAALEQIGATECVTQFRHDAEPWTIEIDPQCDDLLALGETLFSVVNDAGREGEPEAMIVHGPWRVPVEYEHDGGGPPPGPADLRWIRWLADVPVAQGSITHAIARVKLSDDARAVDVMHDLIAKNVVDDERASLQLEGGGSTINLAPGNAAQAEQFAAYERVLAQASSNVGEFTALPPRMKVSVRDSTHAMSVVDAIGKESAALTSHQVSLVFPDGRRVQGKVSELREGLSGESEVAKQVATTGARLTFTDFRDHYSLDVPDVDSFAKFVALVSSDQWKGRPELSVEVIPRYADNPFTLKLELWRVVGPIIVDAHKAGMTETRANEGRSGTAKRTFDIEFKTPLNGPDLTSSEGYRRIVEILRAHQWEGRAQIELAYDEHLLFWSTAEGRAEGAHNSRPGAKQREPYGWGKDFLALWDSTAKR